MAAHDPDFLDPIGPAGVPFPSEGEWLDLPAPPADELTIAPDFVDRTLQAVAAAPTAEQELDRPLLDAVRRRAFAAPEPSPTFVDDTLAALRRDKTARWRELLTRHIAPEPSPQFVARTLAALAAERGVGAADGDRIARLHRWRFAAWPLLAVAAAAMLWLLLSDRPQPPIELRFAQQEPAAFAHAYAATPMAAVLDARDRSFDPHALSAGGPDGTWLLLEAGR
ncbi:MAG: hypothetical protein JNM25_12630 [Planctomycetes bacterium]|nr:hypothetical protein [Planctomycetota bacterium]